MNNNSYHSMQMFQSYFSLTESPPRDLQKTALSGPLMPNFVQFCLAAISDLLTTDKSQLAQPHLGAGVTRTTHMSPLVISIS